MVKITSNFESKIKEFLERQIHELLSPIALANLKMDFCLDANLNRQIHIESKNDHCKISAGNERNLVSGCFFFLEKLGFSFEFSGYLCSIQNIDIFKEIDITLTPTIEDRGIRMHLNFVQDQSCFSEQEFEQFIDNIVRMKYNHLLFHMYNCQEWFPFEYRGVKHLDLSIGNLKRMHLSDDMIGRDKIMTKDHWFPREFEEISDTEELMFAMHERYKYMMERASNRGMKIAVSFEPETISAKFEEHLKQWSEEDIKINKEYSLVNDWQQNWSGQKLVEADVRNPIVFDIALSRAAAIVDNFPNLNELHFISREGTNYKCDNIDEYILELNRIGDKFGFTITDEDISKFSQVVKKPEIALNATCDPYWTVRDGENHFATTLATLRYVEMAYDIINSEMLSIKLAERNIRPVITLYQPNPKTIELCAKFIAKMLEDKIAFHYLGDYGSKDIGEKMDNIIPLLEKKNDVGCVSWLEFDGSMMLLQNWFDSIICNVSKAKSLGVNYMSFNHWRVRGNEHNAKAAVEACFNFHDGIMAEYLGKLFAENAELARKAFKALEIATIYVKNNCFNIGFTADWVVNICTNAPGYNYDCLTYSARLYDEAIGLFEELSSKDCPAKEQAEYLKDMCICSANHLRAVCYLQNAKLPLVGFQCWPLDMKCKNIPPKEILAVLIENAKKGLKYEYEYMEVLSKWVKSCDEQGQLAMHQQGLIEPFENLLNTLVMWSEEQR